MADDGSTNLMMDEAQLAAFLEERYPQIKDENIRIEHVDEWSIHVRMPITNRHLRPGGTVSGATMMQLADVTMYLMVLGQIGPVELAVTTNLNINFLNRPQLGDLIAMGQLLKLGSRLAVGEVGLFSEGNTRPVAHATLTYSLPPEG